jgi:phosphoesterase RecJ-like protein
MNSEPLLDQIVRQIEGAQRILIFSHVRPDGDAVGSALGLMWLLRARGKAAELSFEDPVPMTLRFLPGAEEIENRPLDGHDLILAVDGSDAERYGAHFSAARVSGVLVICIDHHKTNTRFAALNWVDGRYAATAEMLYHLARHAGWSIDERAAHCLATGCVTDTNAFSTGHTTPEVLETVADLTRHGAALSTIIYYTMHLRTQADAMLWGRVLSTLRVERGVAWALNRLADRQEVGAQEEDGGGLVTFLVDIIGVNVAILFNEVDGQTTRLSMRSAGGYDVSNLALAFGGGGHAQAAGATLNLPLEEAVARVIPQAAAIARASTPAH